MSLLDNSQNIFTQSQNIKQKNYKIIGLMLTRDDTDVLDNWLVTYKRFFDKIFCLDGSTMSNSRDILVKHNVEYSHDNEYKNLSHQDHPLRKVVFEKIKKYICKNNLYDYWIVIIHPDEFYQFCITDAINLAYSKNVTLIKANNCHNAPQKNEIKEWKEKKTYKVFRHFLYPGHLECRIFKYSDDLYYDDKRHSCVIPYGVNTKNWIVGGNILHYKIMNFNLVRENGKLKNSCWSDLNGHYPPGHTFEKLEDFIIDKPFGKYKNNKIFKIDLSGNTIISK